MKTIIFLCSRPGFTVPPQYLTGLLLQTDDLKEFKALLRNNKGAAVVMSVGNLQFLDTENGAVALNNAKPSSLHIFIPDAGPAATAQRLLAEEVLKVTTINVAK